MEVKSCKKLKGNLYEVCFDNREKYKLYDDIILKHELLIVKDIKKKTLEKILNENQLLDAYYRALKYINLKMRTEYEIIKYLEKCEFSKEHIDNAIKKLQKEGYLDEEKYVKAYVNDTVNLSSNGPKKIKDSLKKLRINEDIIDKYLNDVEGDIWISKIQKILDKKAKVNKHGEKLFKSKVYSDLILLGYFSEDIKTCLDAYQLDAEDVFQREADKMYKKLSAKYTGVDLELNFKSKMYAKGFDIDFINDYLHSLDD